MKLLKMHGVYRIIHNGHSKLGVCNVVDDEDGSRIDFENGCAWIDDGAINESDGSIISNKIKYKKVWAIFHLWTYFRCAG